MKFCFHSAVRIKCEGVAHIKLHSTSRASCNRFRCVNLKAYIHILFSFVFKTKSTQYGARKKEKRLINSCRVQVSPRRIYFFYSILEFKVGLRSVCSIHLTLDSQADKILCRPPNMTSRDLVCYYNFLL